MTVYSSIHVLPRTADECPIEVDRYHSIYTETETVSVMVGPSTGRWFVMTFNAPEYELWRRQAARALGLDVPEDEKTATAAPVAVG